MKTLKLLWVCLLATLGVFAQQNRAKDLSVTISSKTASMPYNKIMVDVEIKNISQGNVKLLDYFNSRKDSKMFFTVYLFCKVQMDGEGEVTKGYGAGGSPIGYITLGKPGQKLKYITLKPQQVYKYRLNISDLFRDLNEVHIGENRLMVWYRPPMRIKGCEDCYKGTYYSNQITINITK